MSGVDTQNSNLVSELMKQINSSDLYNEPQYSNDYNDNVMQDNGAERPEVQEVEQENNFNPEDLIPPPKEDDVEQKGYTQEEEYTDEEEELYYRDDMSETLKYANREYTSFIMETVKTAIILFIGYIIFSHPLTGFYISNFFSNFPGFMSFMSITTYKLALHGFLFVLFYFIIMYVF